MTEDSTSSPGRVCYLALETLRAGQGSFTHVHEIARGLKDHGWQLVLLSPACELGNPLRPGVLKRLSEWGRLQIRLAIKLQQFDLVYIRSHYMALPISLLCKAAGIPVIQEINGSYEDLFVAYPKLLVFRYVFDAVIRLQYRIANGLIAVTEGLREWVHAETGRDDCVVIPNAANHKLFDPAKVSPSLSELPNRYVIFAGGYAAWHGIHTILEAATSPDWPADISLVVAGEASVSQQVISATERNARIVALGVVSYSKIPRILAGALASLVPNSNPRGRADKGLSPIKLYEAMACKTPVIVSDLWGQADLVRESRCGVVVPVNDHVAIVKAVAMLASNEKEARAMGRRGRQSILRQHTWDHRVAVTERFLASLIESRQPSSSSVPSGQDHHSDKA